MSIDMPLAGTDISYINVCTTLPSLCVLLWVHENTGQLVGVMVACS